MPGGEIADHGLDARGLILRLVVGEARAELVVEPLRRHEAQARLGAPFGRDLDQPMRDLADALLHAGLAALPGGAAEPVERRVALVRAVARQKFEVLDRQEELVAACVVQLEAVVRRLAHLDRLQSDEAADAVVDMDHEVAGRERRDLLQHVRAAARLLAAADQPVAEDVLFADDREIAGLEALFEAHDGQRRRAGRQAERLAQSADRLGPLEAMFGEHAAQPVPRALGPGRDHHLLARRAERSDVLHGRVEDVAAFFGALEREAAAGAGAAIDDGAIRRRCGLEGRHARHGRLGEAFAPFLRGQVEALGGSGLKAAVAGWRSSAAARAS